MTICKEKDCKTNAVYNISGIKTPKYCKKHKTDNMINVKDRHCIELNCQTNPNFNIIGLKQGLYCNKHKKDNMINVTSKKCLELNKKYIWLII